MTDAPPLAHEFRQVVEAARQQGFTLQQVHVGMAAELGRTSASLASDEEVTAWLTRFLRLALAAWQEEREAIRQAVERRPARARRRR